MEELANRAGQPIPGTGQERDNRLDGLPVPCQNSFIGADLAFRARYAALRYSLIRPPRNLHALDPGGDIDGVAGLALRRFLWQTLVRPVHVVVPGVLGQHLSQVPRISTWPGHSRRSVPTNRSAYELARALDEVHTLQAVCPVIVRRPLPAARKVFGITGLMED